MLNKEGLLKDFKDFCGLHNVSFLEADRLLGLVLNRCNYIPISKNNDDEEYKTMFEYFGKPQGKELNESTYKTAVREGIKVNKKEVSNKKYSGFVMSYPVNFLDSLFKINEHETPDPNDDLPF